MLVVIIVLMLIKAVIIKRNNDKNNSFLRKPNISMSYVHGVDLFVLQHTLVIPHPILCHCSIWKFSRGRPLIPEEAYTQPASPFCASISPAVEDRSV